MKKIIIFVFFILIRGSLMATEENSEVKEEISLETPISQKFYFGDIGMQGGSYRILVHHPDDYNRAVWVNSRGENTTEVLENIEDARQYATGHHPLNKYGAPIKKIGQMDRILPVTGSDVFYREFGSLIIQDFANEITKIGPDKNLHFLANVGITEWADCESDEEFCRSLERMSEAIKISILKEVDDKGISHDDQRVVKILMLIDSLKENYRQMSPRITSLGLDKGDLYADLIGMYLGGALMILYQLNFEFGK
jgi:hypothetical protein